MTALDAAVTALDASAACVLYLVDYRLERLCRLGGDMAWVPVEGSDVGRVFASGGARAAQLGARVVWLATVETRGDRLGVLEVSVDAPGPPLLGEEVQLLADAAARAVRLSAPGSDVFERTVRTQRLGLAAELQWQLLPARGARGAGYHLAGQLEPAYHVAGDSFDWAVEADGVWAAVFDGPGRGVPAAQVSTLAVTAARNARRGGLDLAHQARMVNDSVHTSLGGKVAVEALFARFERNSDTATVLAAGSPWLVRQRGGSVEQIGLEPQLPLGAFEGTSYHLQTVPIAAGDRFVLISDGFHAAAPAGRPRFGDTRLVAAVRSLRMLDPPEVARHLVRRLVEYHDGDPLGDDAAVMVVDWSPPC